MNMEELQSYIDKYRKFLIEDHCFGAQGSGAQHPDDHFLYVDSHAVDSKSAIHPIGLEKYAKFGIPLLYAEREQPSAEKIGRWEQLLFGTDK